MPNFIQEKLEELKSIGKQAKQRKFTRKDAAIGVTVALAMVTAIGVSDFNPGVIQHAVQGDKKPVSIAEFSKLAGPQQTITMTDKNPLKRKEQKPKQQTTTGVNPSSLPMSMPSGFAPPSAGSGSAGKVSAALEKARVSYGQHSAFTDKMKSLLSSSFVMKNMSAEPKSGNEDRFTTTFEYANGDGVVLEKFELMTIVRTSRMEGIKTAQQALDSLVEESQSINVIESTDGFLIYDYAGDGGYQVGKIAVDDKGIYIFGYINLTTSDMPEVLKTEWIGKFRDSL